MGGRERVMGKRECEESIYTYTERGQRQRGERHGRESVREESLFNLCI